MNNALTSFVIINNCLNAGIDSIDAFIPFVIRLMKIKQYTDVSIETICHDFTNEYGLQIPRHPMETILNRMKPQYLSREANKVLINQPELGKRAESINFEEENKKYNWLIQNFIDFCAGYSTPIFVSYDEANFLFLNFLKVHDIDIIFAAYTSEKIESLIPELDYINDNDKVYLLNKYVNDLLLKGGVYADYLINSAVGHKYASVLLYREFSNVRGRGTCANYYLDVGILFDIAGLNKSFRKKAAEDLLKLISSKGSRLWVFQHNYDEFMRIIEGTLYWIENEFIDIHKASRALHYFLNEGFGVSEIKLFISQIDAMLERNNIKKAFPLNPNLDQEFQVDREVLKKTILNVYNSNGLFDLQEREETLDLDITSIEYIYKLRKNNVPVNFNHAGHVFLTTNSGLAYASNRYEQLVLERGFFTIPAVLTDTFVGTFVWIEEPTLFASEFNKSKIISYTNSMLAPRENLLKKFEMEINRAKQNEIDPISEETGYLLMTSDLPRRLLADRTLGDPARITAITPYEVLAETKAQLTAEERKRTADALKTIVEISKEKGAAVESYSSQINHTKLLIEKLAKRIKVFIIAFLILMTIAFLVIPEFFEKETILMKIIKYAISVITISTGITISIIGKKVEIIIQKWLTKKLIKQ